MWIQVVSLVVMGQTLAIMPIPTSYETFGECETHAYTASKSVGRRDDVSDKLNLTIVCRNTEDLK